jgi:hypothetical protein
MEKSVPQVWSEPLAVDDIPDAGLHKVIEASAVVRQGVAALAGVRDLPWLAATFDLTRQGDGVHVVGRVQARVGQTCVVTLEPIENEVDEPIDLLFLPGAPAEAEADKLADGVEPPEPLVAGTVDLGAVATEFLMLGIDPYPRKPGVEFAAPKADGGRDKPFAALEALKKRLGGEPS